MAGVSTYTYQKYEQGHSRPDTPLNPKLNTLVALSDVYGIRPCDLLDPDIDFDALGPEQLDSAEPSGNGEDAQGETSKNPR